MSVEERLTKLEKEVADLRKFIKIESQPGKEAYETLDKISKLEFYAEDAPKKP